MLVTIFCTPIIVVCPVLLYLMCPSKSKFTYRDLAFSCRNAVCPPQPYVVISICLTYVYSHLNKFTPWEWQVRAWSTTILSARMSTLKRLCSFPNSNHTPISPSYTLQPPQFCLHWHPTHDHPLKLAGKPFIITYWHGIPWKLSSNLPPFNPL